MFLPIITLHSSNTNVTFCEQQNVSTQNRLKIKVIDDGEKNKDNCYNSLKKVKMSMIIKPNNCWNQFSECTITLGPDNRSTGLHSSKT